jgi:hypothetical protein
MYRNSCAVSQGVSRRLLAEADFVQFHGSLRGICTSDFGKVALMHVFLAHPLPLANNNSTNLHCLLQCTTAPQARMSYKTYNIHTN